MVFLRPGAIGDYRAVAEIERHCFPREPWDEEDVLALLGTSLEEPKLVLLVAFAKATQGRHAKGQVAGYIVGEVEDGHGDLMELAVMEPYRRRGLGRALLDRASQQLRTVGAQEIELQVPVEQAAAIHLYQSAGFVETAPLLNHYNPGDGLRMTRFYPAQAACAAPCRARTTSFKLANP